MSEPSGSTSSALFDLRHLIGGLFVLYGVILTVASPFVDDTKADGLDMNLWLGLGMFALGVFFLAWARLRPLHLEGTSALAARDAARKGAPDSAQDGAPDDAHDAP